MHKREIDEPELRTRDALAQMVDRPALGQTVEYDDRDDNGNDVLECLAT